MLLDQGEMVGARQLSSDQRMTSELETLLRKLLASDEPATALSTSSPLADRAIRLCEMLSRQLASFVGETGVNTLFKRCALRVNESCPWLAYPSPWAADPRDDPWLWMRTSMEGKNTETAAAGFILVLSAVIDLVTAIAGEAVIANVLQELPARLPGLENNSA
jgi:hypothetical protein